MALLSYFGLVDMTNPIIETDLAQILGQINNKLDKLSTDVTDLKVGQAEIKGSLQRFETEFRGEIKRLETKIDSNNENIKEIKGSQRAQIWTLIGILITAVGGFIAAVGRSVFSTV